jgi:hypothetical protein
MVRTFTADFSYDIDESTRRTIPAGWTGEVDEDVAREADAAGATGKPAHKAAKSAKPATADDAPAA